MQFYIAAAHANYIKNINQHRICTALGREVHFTLPWAIAVAIYPLSFYLNQKGNFTIFE